MPESYFSMRSLPDEGHSRPDLCIINFNGARHLAGSLGRIRQLEHQFNEMVFVDDASTDGSAAMARELLPDARFIALPVNSGPGRARNAGMEHLKGTRIFFMDNDVLLGDDVLAQLTSLLDDAPNAVFAMPRIVRISAPDTIEWEGGDAHFSGLVVPRNAGRSVASCSAPPVVEVGSLITCCFLFDRPRWGTDCLFDDEFGMYGDDHELGLRARIRGLDLLLAPQAVCLHGSGTPGLSIRESGAHAPLRIVNTMVNRWQALLKLYQKRTLLLLTPYLLAFELFQLAGCVAMGWHREWVAAVRKLRRLLPGLRVRRHHVQTARLRSDSQVLSGGPHPFNPRLSERSMVRVTLPLLDALAGVNWWLVCLVAGGTRRG